MNLKELIEKCESIVEDKNKSGAVRGTYKKVLKDLKQLDELTEFKGIEIPQCAIDVIRKMVKEENPSLLKAMSSSDNSNEFCDWIESPANQELFARAWIEGWIENYYIVKIKNSNSVFCYLFYDTNNKCWSWASDETEQTISRHTRKELEEAGFNEVFTSSLFKVEEVKLHSMIVRK